MPKLDLEEPSALADIPAAVRVSAAQTIGSGYRSYERYEVSLPYNMVSSTFERDVLRSGKVVGVLPVDVRREQVVLIRQFRLASHIAFGNGGMIEIPAGMVGAHETAYQAACRECYEEIGTHSIELRPLFALMPAPALTDECMTLYAALIDAGKVTEQTGCQEEQEVIEPRYRSMPRSEA
jgi:ADP-ribose pyrophosphatase